MSPQDGGPRWKFILTANWQQMIYPKSIVCLMKTSFAHANEAPRPFRCIMTAEVLSQCIPVQWGRLPTQWQLIIVRNEDGEILLLSTNQLLLITTAEAATFTHTWRQSRTCAHTRTHTQTNNCKFITLLSAVINTSVVISCLFILIILMGTMMIASFSCHSCSCWTEPVLRRHTETSSVGTWVHNPENSS